MKAILSNNLGLCMIVADEELAMIYVDDVLQSSQGSAMIVIEQEREIFVRVTCQGFEDNVQIFKPWGPLSYCYLSMQRRRHLKLVDSKKLMEP